MQFISALSGSAPSSELGPEKIARSGLWQGIFFLVFTVKLIIFTS
jgi:hypothetical protein